MRNEILSLAICLTLFVSCETASKDEDKKNSIETHQNSKEVEVKNITASDIENLVKEYNAKSDTSKIRFVDSLGCESKRNMELYSNDIYVYSILEIKKQKFDYNGDNLEDYVISYTANNCWQGNGAGNYLSNYIFATSKSNKLEINYELTNLFRGKFQQYVNTNFGKSDYDYSRIAMFINGIEFESSIGETVSGTFAINTPKCNTALPCIYGVFDFNTKSGHIEFKDIENEMN